MDFMHERLAYGRGYRTFNVLVDYNRDRLGIKVEFSLLAPRVIPTPEQIIEWRYNTERPNMALGGITPKRKLAQAA